MSRKIEITVENDVYAKLAGKADANRISIEEYVARLAMAHVNFDVATTSGMSMNHETMASAKEMEYFSTRIPQLDKVIGGGLVLGHVLLLGAPRGCGKTTLLLQACDGFAKDGRKAYFASGEMNKEALLAYAKRLGITNPDVLIHSDPEGINVEDLFEEVIRVGAKLLVIDSLQTVIVSDVKGNIGEMTMMDAVVNMVSSFAQEKSVACVIVGHIGKAGDYLGSAKVQFLVDGLIRMDTRWIYQPDGKPVDSMVRELSMDGKSRQGRSDLTALVELTDDGIRPPSAKALRALNKLVTER